MQDFQARAETVQENWNSYLSYDNTKLYIKIIHLPKAYFRLVITVEAGDQQKRKYVQAS